MEFEWQNNYPSTLGNVDMNIPKPTFAQPDSTFLGLDMGTWQGIGTLTGVIGGLLNASAERSYKNKLFKEEKRRIAREEARQDKFEAGMRKAYK